MRGVARALGGAWSGQRDLRIQLKPRPADALARAAALDNSACATALAFSASSASPRQRRALASSSRSPLALGKREQLVRERVAAARVTLRARPRLPPPIRTSIAARPRKRSGAIRTARPTFSSPGAGETITGVGEIIKARKPGFKCIAVEPDASPVLSGGTKGPHVIRSGCGIRARDPEPRRVRLDHPRDERRCARDRVRMAKEKALFVDISSAPRCGRRCRWRTDANTRAR